MNLVKRHRILTDWPAMFAQAKIIDSHAGFSGAIVERIEVAGQHFALRGWPKRVFLRPDFSAYINFSDSFRADSLR